MTDEDNPRKPWNFNIEWHRLAANATVVHIAGDLRGDGAASLRRTLAGELTGTPELLVLDLSDIEQIDADGIDALHSVAELADEDDIRMCLVVLPKGAVRACLKVVELMKTFQTFSSVTEALQNPHDRPAQRVRPAIAKHLAILCGENSVTPYIAQHPAGAPSPPCLPVTAAPRQRGQSGSLDAS